MKDSILYITIATVSLNFVMALLLSKVGGEFKKSVRASIIAALLANLWAIGALLVLLFPIHEYGGVGKYLFLLAPMAIMYWLIWFADNFPFSNRVLSISQRKTLTVAWLASTTIVALCADRIILGSQINTVIYEPSVAPVLYCIYAGYFAAFSRVFSQTFSQKIKRLPEERKPQAQFAFRGILLSSFVAFITNLFLPVLGVGTLLWAGPTSSFIYAFSFLYAMRRYRLFEVRRFATRALGYVFTLGCIVGLYMLCVLATRQILVDVFRFPVNIEIFYASMTAIAILVYSPIRKSFDTITKQIFFKNEYEIQNILDILGDILLRAKLRRDIAARVAKLLRNTLLTDKAELILFEDSQASTLSEFFKSRKSNVVSLDTDENTDIDIAWMRKQGFEVIVDIRLQTRHLGWLVLGPKRSGDAYILKDVTLLNIAADEIAIALENSLQLEQIQEFNRTLQDRVSDATKEMRETNKKLRQLDASKDEFISMASHQLRTPLTSIKGYISMLLDEDLGEIKPEQRKALEEAFDSSQRMVYLIGDFLNLSRMQTGKFELERAVVSLPLLLREEITQLRQSAKARHVTLLYDEPANFPLLNIDETKIRQVMMNFIDNAIFYAKPEGGEILLVLETQRDEILFRVKDNGIGVPAQARRRLFSKFFRADNAKKARPDGTGIGLFMAKRVVVAHGGEIIFESKEGEGSEFGFRLPTK
ncbi:MAG: HAMP domain-containing sensor histidine kinase [Candidatus Saccharimonadales bacterium]